MSKERTLAPGSLPHGVLATQSEETLLLDSFSPPRVVFRKT